MPAVGVIALFSKLKDVSFVRTDLSPVQQGDVPRYETSASKLFMGPAGTGGGGAGFSLGLSTGGNTAGDTGVTGSQVVLVADGALSGIQATDPSGATITLSAPQQSVQTQNRFNLTLAGNTDGALQEVSSGTLTLAGGDNITLSQNGNAISIIGGASAPDTQTAISGVGNSETTYTSGTVNLLAQGNLTIRSTTGQAFQLSVAPQSVQPETQTFIGGVANSETTYSSGTVKLSALGNVTIRSTTGQQLQISVPAQSVQPETQTFVGGIIASDTTYTSGSIRFTGVGGGVTVSSNTGQRVDISVAAPVAQTNQTLGMYALGNTTGQSSSTTFDARTVSIRGDGIVSVGYSGGTLRISASQSVQAETQTFVAGIIASDTTYTSGSVRFTGVGGGITVSSNTGQRVDLSVAAQTGTQFSAGLSTMGNTSGDTGTVGGRLLLAGGNNITVSGSTNGASMTITISGPNVGGAQTGISGFANSETTYTSGTVKLSELGAITIRSTTGQQFQLSVNAQTQESQSFGMSNIGNTSGTTGIASGAQLRFLLAGGNNITLSQSLNGASGTITISAFTQSAESQSIGMSNLGNTSGTTGIASGAQVRFLFAGGNNITLSQSLNGASGTITISGPNTAAQSNQTLGMYAVQNTTGQSSSTTMDARTLSIAGDGIVSVGYSGGSLRISASQSVQAETQTFIGGVANTETTYTSGTVKLLELGAITIRSTTGNQFQLSVNSQTNQSEGWYALGNTTGQSSSTTLDARTISIRGDGIVSVGYSNGSVRISASQSVQAETQTFIGGIANTETTYTSGTVKLLELGAITIRSTTGNQFQLSVNAQTVESQSIGMSNLGNTSGTTGMASGGQVLFALAGGNNITLSQSLNGASGTITISGGAGGGFSAGVSNIGNTSGDTGITGSRLVLSGGQSITLSQSTNASGATVGISGASTSQSNQSLGMYAVNNTTGQSSSTTMDARTLSIAGDGAVSVGYSAGSLRISAPAQTGTQFSGGISGGNTSGDTGTVGGRLVLAGGNNITLSGSTNGASETITISAFTQSAESQSIGMSNLGNTAGTTGVASGAQVRFVILGTNNISLSQSLNGASGTISISGQPSFSAGVSTGGNTQGNTGVSGTRLVLVGSDNVTLSQATDASGATVSFKGVSPGAAAYSVGVSNLGNTAGSTGVTGTRIVLAGTGSVTLSQSTDATGATISISAGGGFSAGASNLGNTAGDTGVSGSRLVLVGTNPISLSQATNTAGATVSFDAPVTSSIVGASGISISTSGSTISVIPIANTSFNPFAQVGIVANGQQGAGTLHIQPIQVPHLQFDRILASYQFSNATNSSNSFTLSHYMGIYTKNNSTLSLVSSISTSTNFSGSGTAGSYSLYGGMRNFSIPWTMTLTSGDYWVGIVSRTTTGGGAGHTAQQVLMSRTTFAGASAYSGLLGAASGATAQQELGLGTYSVTTAGIPSAIQFSEITGSGSLVLFKPLFHFRSGTA